MSSTTFVTAPRDHAARGGTTTVPRGDSTVIPDGAARPVRTEWSLWTCANCRRETREPRKRCMDCGTSRY